MRAVIGVVVAGLVTGGGVSGAQTRATGSIAGRVTDSTGAHLADAIIDIAESTDGRARTSTDGSGQFALRGIDVGRVHVVARRLGFAPETLLVAVVANAEVVANFVLQQVAAQIAGEIVEADPLRGKMGPFNKRKARGVGTFFTREEIEKRQPASISELLRSVPGVGVTQQMAGQPQPVRMTRSVNSSMQSTCVVQLYVDGHPYPNGNVDDFNPSAIEGIEVYRSASEIPADFRTQDATCGVISLWTRDPEAARRNP